MLVGSLTILDRIVDCYRMLVGSLTILDRIVDW